jgi:hypothetical protein
VDMSGLNPAGRGMPRNACGPGATLLLQKFTMHCVSGSSVSNHPRSVWHGEQSLWLVEVWCAVSRASKTGSVAGSGLRAVGGRCKEGVCLDREWQCCVITAHVLRAYQVKRLCVCNLRGGGSNLAVTAKKAVAEALSLHRPIPPCVCSRSGTRPCGNSGLVGVARRSGAENPATWGRATATTTTVWRRQRRWLAVGGSGGRVRASSLSPLPTPRRV